MARTSRKGHPALVDKPMLEKLYLVIQNTPQMIILSTPEGTVEFVNETFTEITGFTPAETVGKSLWELQCSNVNQEMCTQLQEIVRQQRQWRGEMANWKKNGELYWESVAVSMIRNEGGDVTDVIVVKEDVTEQKRTEERLFESEERFKAFMDNSPTISWMKDKEGRYVYTSKTYPDRFGFPGEDWIGKTDFEIWPEETASVLWEHDRQVLNENRQVAAVEEIPARSGRRWWWNFRFPFRDAIGKMHIGGVGIDITDQKEAQEAVRATSDLLRKVLENMPLGVWILDREGKVVQANKAAHKIWGGASYVGIDQFGEYKGWWLDTGKRIGPHEWGAARAIMKGESSVDEVEIESFDGARKIIINLSVPLRNDEGEVTGAIAVNQDITERKLAEAERERLIAEVQRSNHELQQFAYVASHDLQEPLRMIGSYMTLLERKYHEKLDDKAKSYISHAVEGARRMQRLIEGLLNYSRISTETELSAVDANLVFAAATANLEQAVRESGGQVTADHLPVVRGDETQLVQLFQNLIGNGLKYHRPEVPPVVHVSARHSGTEWIFSVIDNGIGIAPQYYDKVFQIFQRLHTKEEYPGTGIGLASCKKIVERHGGRIWVESAPGEGSVFHFALPSEH